MATFTHTVTWIINVEGRSTTVEYSYDIENVTNIQKVETSDEQYTAERRLDYAVAPAFIAGVSHTNTAYSNNVLAVQESGSGAEARFGALKNGMATVVHLSSAGGNINQTGTNATTTLVSSDYVVMKASGIGPINCTIIALHQAAS